MRPRGGGGKLSNSSRTRQYRGTGNRWRCEKHGGEGKVLPLPSGINLTRRLACLKLLNDLFKKTLKYNFFATFYKFRKLKEDIFLLKTRKYSFIHYL